MMKTFHLPTVTMWRRSRGEAEAHDDDLVCSNNVESLNKGPAQEKAKNKRNILHMLKKTKKQPKTCTPDSTEILDFNQNVKLNLLAEASQQLLAKEMQLFKQQSSNTEVNCPEDEEDSLQKDYEILMLHLRMAVQDSFNKENQKILCNALKAISQQEEQDRNWKEEATEKCPRWRPLKCREIHDILLKNIVEVRLQQANEEENGADRLSTSLKREVCRMGKRIQKDLLQVVRDVQQCYTPEFDICNMYIQLYHQAFSTKLMELAQTTTEIQDCIYILSWIHVYYPKDILQHSELKPHINTESLEALLPEKDLKSLEEQYLSHKEVEVSKWLSNALKKEEEMWQTSVKPELIDGCYFSNLAIDVIPIIEAARKETIEILGNTDQRILHQLHSFLESYKKSIAELIKGKHTPESIPDNIPNNLKANLNSIRQFREYIEKHDNLTEGKKDMLFTVSEMRDSCHSYFLTPIHKNLKEQYRKLWTPAWFSQSHTIIDNLLSFLEDMIQHFTDLQSACLMELLRQLYSEVMIQYVKRILKGKLKLKDKDEQEAAARFMCEDSARINSVFIKIGLEDNWLYGILPKLSEVVRLQDPGALQLEIVTLARTFPDISECQVLALLSLKANLSKADVRSIKNSLTENRDSLNTEPTTDFFSKVPIKRKLL
ncbi:tumor necrosis factor alpha-induced protein 2a isoform X1 [Silurus meridionalis]|uniref:Tumor necrosis factor alpha-induced protein 2 n=1 Tax=Silurus meridionalis TaxID=175797 RepID=A0A8T0ADN0_SILME|nr:tumor necrosis factor alpha-induced protein 2a isoform X1 [Silurus meridionalis]KAF7690220.1 hypothetical protein HF521_012024 [Silurus meridionalis]